METTDKVGQAQPESGNATGFNRWLFTPSRDSNGAVNFNITPKPLTYVRGSELYYAIAPCLATRELGFD